MMRTTILLILILALAGPASAVPVLPAEFWGTVSIDGSAAPAGTVITARIDDSDCGTLTTAAAGVYGGEALFDERLLVSGEDTDAGKTIAFFVNGVPAAETAIYGPGTSARLDLAVASEGAAFSANVTSGPAPLTVRFTDLSVGSPTSWSWTFGDGGTSTEQHPIHTYTTPGTYTVNLTVSTGNGPDTFSWPGYITVTNVTGDFNGNGAVDVGDVSKVAYMVVGKAAADSAADFNGNGAVDIGDAAKIAYYFVGKVQAL